MSKERLEQGVSNLEQIKSEAVRIQLGTVGFYAEEIYSGNTYRKWVSKDGRVVIGSLPSEEDEFPDLAQVGEHMSERVKWKPALLGEFSDLGKE